MPDSEIVWGAAAIGRLINRSPRQTHYLLSQGLIQAAGQLGTLWWANRADLIAQFGGGATPTATSEEQTRPRKDGPATVAEARA